jgi:hypothetical protein
MKISTLARPAMVVAASVAMAFNVQAENVEVISVDPEAGEVTSLSNITIGFSVAVYKLDGASEVTTLKITDQDNNEYAYTATLNARNATLNIELKDEITAPGTYKVHLDEGELMALSLEVNEAVDITYTIAGESGSDDDSNFAPIEEYMAMPDPEEDQTSLSNIMIYLPEIEEPTLVAWETGDYSLIYATVEKDGKKVTQGMLDMSTYMRMDVISIDLDDAVAEAGTYTVTIPAGAIKDDASGTVYGKLVLTYNVVGVGDAKFTVSPEDNSQLTSLVGDIKFTYTDYEKVGFASGPFMVSVLNSDGKSVGSFETSLPGFKNIVQISIDEEDAITTPGTYTITIPSGSVLGFIDEDGNSEAIGAATVTYVVGDGGSSSETEGYKVTIDPEEGEVEELGSFTLTFEGANLVKASDEATRDDFPYYGTVDAEGNITKVSQLSANTYAGNNTMTVKTYTTVTAAGKYAIVVPKGYYFVDGNEPAEELVFYYTIAEPEVKMYMEAVFVDPEEEATVENLDKIKFTFKVYDENYEEITEGLTYKHNSYTAPKLGLLNDDKASFKSYNNGTISGTDPDLLWSSYYGVTDAGYYIFTIPANYMTATDANGNTVSNGETMAMFEFAPDQSGVGSIKFEKIENGAIYNLNGVKLDADANNLPAGIYIINGKKTVVK